MKILYWALFICLIILGCTRGNSTASEGLKTEAQDRLNYLVSRLSSADSVADSVKIASTEIIVNNDSLCILIATLKLPVSSGIYTTSKLEYCYVKAKDYETKDDSLHTYEYASFDETYFSDTYKLIAAGKDKTLSAEAQRLGRPMDDYAASFVHKLVWVACQLAGGEIKNGKQP